MNTLKELAKLVGISIPFYMLLLANELPKDTTAFGIYGIVLTVCYRLVEWGFKKNKDKDGD